VTQPIAPCLWFDGNAEEAVNYYVSIFNDSKILHIDRYSESGPDPDAPAVFIEFQINGQPFQAINGGPEFQFSEAISFSIVCEDQQEVDYYWDALTDGGEPVQCGWLKDRYGVSWQVVPEILIEMLGSVDTTKSQWAMQAMLQMKKINIDELRRAYDTAL
jgi:predicted 3-demethylubiquinone-9 3-methyltransferase (glyoxalase superfamily)